MCVKWNFEISQKNFKFIFQKSPKIKNKVSKFFVEILEKIRINQAGLSKRTCVANEISKFHKKIQIYFSKTLQKFSKSLKKFCEIFEKN